MPDVELSAGTIKYEDTGGSGPVVVLLHGLAMDGSVWRGVVADLRPDYRCVVPTLSLRGQIRLVAEFLERLDAFDLAATPATHGSDLDFPDPIGSCEQTLQRWRLVDSVG